MRREVSMLLVNLVIKKSNLFFSNLPVVAQCDTAKNSSFTDRTIFGIAFSLFFVLVFQGSFLWDFSCFTCKPVTLLKLV